MVVHMHPRMHGMFYEVICAQYTCVCKSIFGVYEIHCCFQKTVTLNIIN